MCKHFFPSKAPIMAQVKQLNQEFRDAKISLETFKKKKAKILQNVSVSHRDVIANMFVF